MRIMAICGSTRKKSSNLALLKAIDKITAKDTSLSIFEGLTALPHFNPDMENECTPTAIIDFREKLRVADAIIICTPEYAMGVPGTLKNAIDWTVSSMEFSKKPVALITASLAGERGHASLLETLTVIEAKMTSDTQLLISFIKTKINEDNRITDGDTLNKVKNLVKSLENLVHEQRS